jgi:hypothetical protein
MMDISALVSPETYSVKPKGGSSLENWVILSCPSGIELTFGDGWISTIKSGWLVFSPPEITLRQAQRPVASLSEKTFV